MQTDEMRQAIAAVSDEVRDLLLAKNKDYKASAFDVPILAPNLSAEDAICCRMSDKVARLARLRSGASATVAESIDDTIRDLAGYSILWLVVRRGIRPTTADARSKVAGTTPVNEGVTIVTMADPLTLDVALPPVDGIIDPVGESPSGTVEDVIDELHDRQRRGRRALWDSYHQHVDNGTLTVHVGPATDADNPCAALAERLAGAAPTQARVHERADDVPGPAAASAVNYFGCGPGEDCCG